MSTGGPIGVTPQLLGYRETGMPVPRDSICPESGMQMVARTYVVRQIEDSDRLDYDRQVESAEARGDSDEVAIIKETLARWERDQGHEEEKLVCPVCEDRWLTPTFKGTSRPHRRRDWERPSWDRVRHLGKDIQSLQAELDRVLESLEPSSESSAEAASAGAPAGFRADRPRHRQTTD